jgi:hypothetical protein
MGRELSHRTDQPQRSLRLFRRLTECSLALPSMHLSRYSQTIRVRMPAHASAPIRTHARPARNMETRSEAGGCPRCPCRALTAGPGRAVLVCTGCDRQPRSLHTLSLARLRSPGLKTAPVQADRHSGSHRTHRTLCQGPMVSSRDGTIALSGRYTIPLSHTAESTTQAQPSRPACARSSAAVAASAAGGRQ